MHKTLSCNLIMSVLLKHGIKIVHVHFLSILQVHFFQIKFNVFSLFWCKLFAYSEHG